MDIATMVAYDGKIIPEKDCILLPDNRSFRYGDGFFETIRMVNGVMPFFQAHMQRIATSLELLQLSRPHTYTAAYFENIVRELVQRQNPEGTVRIRISFFRDSIHDTIPHFLVQCRAMDQAYPSFNMEGLTVGICEEVQLPVDRYACLKHSSRMPYTMASLWAKRNGLQEAILINGRHQVADATIANVFVVRGDEIFTPGLDSGCVAGVMRGYLLQQFRENHIICKETALTPDDIRSADELFFTNALYGMRWVAACEGTLFKNNMSKALYQRFLSHLH